jgi:hypothetical protein
MSEKSYKEIWILPIQAGRRKGYSRTMSSGCCDAGISPEMLDDGDIG